MRININEKSHELESDACLLQLVKQLSIDDKGGIAIAVNAYVVPKKEWPHFELKENDEIIIIEAAQGG